MALTGLGGLGACRPHTTTVAREFASRFPILQFWAYNPKSNGEHGQGRALDMMVFENSAMLLGAKSLALGEAIYKAAWADRHRLGIEYIIWNRTITSTVVSPGVRRYYSGTNSHRDHVHITFLDNPPAYKPYLEKREVSPAGFNEAWIDDNKAGVEHPTHEVAVQYGQLALNHALGLQLEIDGWHGPGTHKSAQAYQRKLGHSVTDVLTPVEWSQLGKDSGAFTYTPPVPKPEPLRAWASFAVLEPHNISVSLVQRALNKLAGTDVRGGLMDAATIAAIKTYQEKIGATPDGTLSYSQFQKLAKDSGLFEARP